MKNMKPYLYVHTPYKTDKCGVASYMLQQQLTCTCVTVYYALFVVHNTNINSSS